MSGRAQLQQSSGKSWEAKLGIWITYKDRQGSEKTVGGIVQLQKSGCHLWLQDSLAWALRSGYLLWANSNSILKSFRELKRLGRLCKQSSSVLLFQVSAQKLRCWLFYHWPWALSCSQKWGGEAQHWLNYECLMERFRICHPNTRWPLCKGQFLVLLTLFLCTSSLSNLGLSHLFPCIV